MSLKDFRRLRESVVPKLVTARKPKSASGGSGVDRPGRLTELGRKAAVAVLVACALLATLVAADHWANSGEVYGGVTVAEVPLGGHTPAEARSMLEERASGAPSEIRFTGGPNGETFVLPAGNLGLGFDVAGTVDRAYAFGREGSVLERLGERAGAFLGHAAVEPTVRYDRETAGARVGAIAERLDSPAVDASVIVQGQQVGFTQSATGYELDVPATLRSVERTVGQLGGEVPLAGEVLEPEVTTEAAQTAAEQARGALSGPVILASGEERWTLSPAEIGQSLYFEPAGGGELRVGLDRVTLRQNLSQVFSDLAREPKDAGFRVQDGEVRVTQSEDGRAVDEGKFLDSLENGLLGEGERSYEVPLAAQKPELSTEQARQLRPTEMLGSYRTNYQMVYDGPERVENLQIASNAINNTALAPGEVFSVNELAAPLDYHATKVIVEGRETLADGGGLCQVASTLYMAANYAGLEVLERHPHHAALPYIRPGLDATVWFGSLDMKFRNTTDAYVLVREYVADDGYIYAEVWGRPTGTEVTMTSRPTYRGADAASWVTYKTVKEGGKVVFDDVLHTDTYKSLIDKDGREVPPSEIVPAPVNP